MILIRHYLLVLGAAAMVLAAGCGSPTPVAENKGPPPPPPAPVPEPKPVPPPPQPKADPYEVALREVGAIMKRYGTVYAGIRDEATADKAVEEIGKLSARLHELAAEIAKIPYRAGQEKHSVALQAELTQMTAQLSNPQTVVADPDVQLKLLPAQQAFIAEALGAMQAVISRHPSERQPPNSENAAKQ
jgi:hypothetical protein